MTPLEFHRRYSANVNSYTGLDNLPELRNELLEFVVYDAALLKKFGVSKGDVAYLSEVGLPRQAAPFLDFSAYSETDLRDIYRDTPSNIFPLGGNGSGDLLGIDVSTANVIYLNHDKNNERVFINSSVATFVETLCLYQEYMTSNNDAQFLSSLAKIDQPASADGGMWRAELRSA